MTEKIKKIAIKSEISQCKIEISKGGKTSRVTVCGIVGIEDFSDTLVRFSSHAGRVRIFGTALRMSIMENKIAAISGKIEGIGFE